MNWITAILGKSVCKTLSQSQRGGVELRYMNCSQHLNRDEVHVKRVAAVRFLALEELDQDSVFDTVVS
ncbi:unnamed protein product [Cylicocyclus nassatus]|uniref:Uncharacterized protein n=1 Tax=Cylicocyclus nassatus TaxID=53992 RepID=A0AA36GJM1_CYLNA|nr:unnamed protein product [Cylicocyclus nassatus]